jgi:hypothetical protein
MVALSTVLPYKVCLAPEVEEISRKDGEAQREARNISPKDPKTWRRVEAL